MVWYFIDVYIINKTLHVRLEIRNFSSLVEKIFHSFATPTREIFFSTLEEKFCISARPSYILHLTRPQSNIKIQILDVPDSL